MTEKAAANQKVQKGTQLDTFKQNCAEFGDDDMGTTKLCVYYNFAQHFSPIFLQKLTAATEATGQDIIPFNGLEHLLKFLKDKSLAGRPLYPGQVQLETFFFFTETGKKIELHETQKYMQQCCYHISLYF